MSPSASIASRICLRFAKWHAAVETNPRAVQPRQAGEADFLFDQEAVRLGLVAFANEMRRRDRFSECVDALEALAVVRHHFAGEPQIIQSQRAVLAAAITLRSRPCRHLEVAVAHGAALAQDRPHFDDRIGVVAGHAEHSRRAARHRAHGA